MADKASIKAFKKFLDSHPLSDDDMRTILAKPYRGGAIDEPVEEMDCVLSGQPGLRDQSSVYFEQQDTTEFVSIKGRRIRTGRILGYETSRANRYRSQQPETSYLTIKSLDGDIEIADEDDGKIKAWAEALDKLLKVKKL